MSVHNQEIAQRLRAIRELSELTPEALAAQMGMDAQEYLRYESGQTDIPISALYDVSHALGVSITELLTGEQAKLHLYSLVRRGKGVDVERSKVYRYSDLAYNFINRKVSPFLVTIDPAGDDEPWHMNMHLGQEYHYCLEGSFKVNLAGRELTVREGDSLYFDAGNPHGMKAIGDKPAQVLVVVI